MRKIMATYVEVEQAIGMPGLRVVLSPGVPGPWSEAAKGILHVKKLTYVKVRQDLAGENVPLRQWTAQTTAPAFVFEDERPRSLWIDQLYLAERLAPNPPLIPASIDDRIPMFGLSNELCGENGFGWQRRLMLIHATLTSPNAPEQARKPSEFLGKKYGYAAELASDATHRVAAILERLSIQLKNQQSRGSKFLIGDALSALDIYWAAFAALIEPLPDEVCKMAPGFRRGYHCTDPIVRAAMAPELLAHRDFIYQNYLELPLDM
jgi:glutathione S-transferase